MTFFNWIAARLSHRRHAIRLYRRGMRNAKLHDHRAAIADYTAVIDMVHAPDNVRAMALYNRSLVFAATGRGSQAALDLEALLEMPAAPPNVKTEARRKLVRIGRAADRIDERSND